MKTVIGFIKGVEEHLRYTGRNETVELGEVHADRCVRYLLGLPRVKTPEDGNACPPTFRLEGRRGMWMEFVRPDSSPNYLLSMMNGETDLLVDEMQAVYRARLFIEHHGEETHHTMEIRLPPELRAEIRRRNAEIDSGRKKKLESAAPRVCFVQRASAFKLFKKYELIVDRKAGEILEQRGGKTDGLFRLKELELADVEGLGKDGRNCRVLVDVAEGRDGRPLGSAFWTEQEAIDIAEAINDAIDLPERRRRLLHYRRAGEETGGQP